MLSDHVNIGKEIERQLHAVGINTIEDLSACGAETAWLKIQEIDPSACLNRLMGLEGAVQNIRWHDLPEADKRRLKAFYQDHKLPVT